MSLKYSPAVARQANHCLAFLLLTLFGPTAVAGEVRTWTSSGGRHKIEAEMVSLEGHTVTLKRSDGKILKVPLDKLSEADQEYARQLAVPPTTDSSDAKPSEPANGHQKPAVDKPAAKTGHFRLPGEQGISLAVYLDALAVYQPALPPKLVAQAKSNADAMITEKEGVAASWEVYVPGNYQASRPYGLFVYINSTDSGRLPKHWRGVFDNHHLIWAGGNHIGNNHDTVWRHAMALEAVRRLRAAYHLDADRLYISGYSGGGRVASHVMVSHAHVFSGGNPHAGCNPYRKLRAKNGGFYGSAIKSISPAAVKAAQQRSRFVFSTGTKDFNREQTQLIAEQYLGDGFRHVHYHEVPGMGHTPPPADWFEKGIEALDAPLRAIATEQFSQGQRLLDRSQFGKALDAYRRAAFHGQGLEFSDQARTEYEKLLAQYEEAKATIRKQLKAQEFKEATKALTVLRKQWGQIAQADAKALTVALREARKSEGKRGSAK